MLLSRLWPKVVLKVVFAAAKNVRWKSKKAEKENILPTASKQAPRTATRAKSSIATLERTVNKHHTRILSLEASNSDLEAQNLDLHTQLHDSRARLHSLEEVHSTTTQQLSELQHDLSIAHDTISEQALIIRQKNQRINRLMRDKSVLAAKLACIKQDQLRPIFRADTADSLSASLCIQRPANRDPSFHCSTTKSQTRLAQTRKARDTKELKEYPDAGEKSEMRSKGDPGCSEEEFYVLSMNRRAYTTQYRSLALAFTRAGCAQARIGGLLTRIGNCISLERHPPQIMLNVDPQHSARLDHISTDCPLESDHLFWSRAVNRYPRASFLVFSVGPGAFNFNLRFLHVGLRPSTQASGPSSSASGHDFLSTPPLQFLPNLPSLTQIVQAVVLFATVLHLPHICPKHQMSTESLTRVAAALNIHGSDEFDCVDVCDEWRVNQINPNLQVHILVAVYGSKIWLNSLHRILLNLEVSYQTSESIGQLRRKLKSYIYQLWKAKSPERLEQQMLKVQTSHHEKLQNIHSKPEEAFLLNHYKWVDPGSIPSVMPFDEVPCVMCS
ncbi:hypothetical protein B0H13DRAFT_1850105 [Mycena leptocephala]|nr:hypothetical protein B0H13DRAFT_1850105 [Mycena leptocephala]